MIHIQNRYLPALIKFLEGMKLAGAQSRARSKLLAKIVDAYTDLAVSERELVKEYALLNKQGEPEIDAEGTFQLKDPNQATEYVAARDALVAEHAVIAPAYAEHPAQLLELLTGYEVELSGDDAAVYDHLFDAVEQVVTP